MTKKTKKTELSTLQIEVKMRNTKIICKTQENSNESTYYLNNIKIHTDQSLDTLALYGKIIMANDLLTSEEAKLTFANKINCSKLSVLARHNIKIIKKFN